MALISQIGQGRAGKIKWNEVWRYTNVPFELGRNEWIVMKRQMVAWRLPWGTSVDSWKVAPGKKQEIAEAIVRWFERRGAKAVIE